MRALSRWMAALLLAGLMGACDSDSGGGGDTGVGPTDVVEDTGPGSDVSFDVAISDIVPDAEEDVPAIVDVMPDMGDDTPEPEDVATDVEELEPNMAALKALGVNIELGPRTSYATGEEVDEDAHPLNAQHTALGKISELFGVGFEYRSGYGHNYFLLDDAGEAATDLIAPTGNEDWTEAHPYFPMKVAVGADLDGDGREEIVTAYGLIRNQGDSYILEEVKFRVMQDKGESYAEAILSPLADVGDHGAVEDLGCAFWGTCLTMAAGDLDGDGNDELVFVTNVLGRMYVLSYEGDQLVVELAHTFPASAQEKFVDVAAADVDADGRAEVAVAISDGQRNDGVSLATYVVWDVTTEGLEQAASDLLATENFQLEFMVAVTAADIDGDHVPELVYGGRNEEAKESGYDKLLVMEDGRGIAAGGQADPYTLYDSTPAVSDIAGILKTGDFDGDNIDEVLAGKRIVDFDEGSTWAIPIDMQATRPALVAVGDFDDQNSDGRADVAVLYINMDSSMQGPSYARFGIFGSPPGAGDAIVQRKNIILFQGTYTDTLDYFFGTTQHAALAVANVDDDTRIVEYTGDHTVLYSDPLVIAVLASAPYHDDCSHADGYTVLGDSTTSGMDASHAVGANLAFSIGASAESPMWGSAGSFEAKITVELAVDFLWGGGSELTYTSAVENPAGQDLVVFTAVPYDAYAYRVIESPDPDEIGELFSLNIPRPARVHSVEREYYNANNGDAADIGPAVLSHTVGDPSSYPSAAERDAMIAGSHFVLMSNQTHTCGGGGAVWSLGCEWSEEHSVGFAVDLSIQSEIETVSGGLLLGISGGYHFGVEVVWHWSNATFIEGAVGDVMPADWEASQAFDWGVFAYDTTIPGQGRPVAVVTYWVE